MRHLKLYYLALVKLLFSGCASSDLKSYVDVYQQEERVLSSEQPVSDDHIQAFIDLLGSLHSANLSEQIEAVYADSLYFNDTLNTLRSREELITYLQHTADNLEQYTFTADDIVQSRGNVYIRWTMKMKFSAVGKAIDSLSVGMTHLKFNSKGQVVLQQDYWDGVEAIYQHLPYVGYWFRKVRDKL